MSQCTLQSNRPKTIVRLGNDTPLLLALTTSLGEVINLNEVTNLSVAIVSARSGRAITPPWQVTPSGGLSIEFSVAFQSIGIYGLRVQFDRLSEGFADGLQAYAWEDTNLIEVVPTSTALPTDTPNTISGVLAAITKGDKGDPGSPMELLDELSRQQSVRMDEIATAQSVSLTSIGSRLSDEQRTALEELAGRLSREQAGQIAQQTERLSTEQASGLQTISDRLSSEQAETLHRQGQERATAQRSALEALDHEVNRKYDTSLEGLSGKVSEAVEVQLPRLVEGKVAEAVDAKLPAVVGNKIAEVAERELPSVVGAQLPAALTEQLPSQLFESLPSIIGLDDQSRLTIGGQPIGQSLKGADGHSAVLSVAGVRPVQDRPDHSGVYRRNRRDTAYSPDLGTPESQGYALFPNTQRYYQSHIMGASNMDFLWLYTPPSDHSSLVMVVQSQSRSGATPIISYKTSTGVVRVEGQVLRAAGTLTRYLAACALHDVVGQIWITMTSGDPGGDTGMYSMALYRMSIDEAPRTRGTWAQRPKTPYIGQQYIATDMRRNGVGDLPMWYNGQMWIDYEGHDVTRRYLAEG